MIKVSVLALSVALVVVLVPTTPTLAAFDAVANPSVTGPIPSAGTPGGSAHDYVFYSTPMNLSRVGYVEQEYFISGTATRFAFPVGSGAPASLGTMPYRTRIVVRRPANARNFSGIVVVDWQNVTGGHDIDTEWGLAGEFFVRAGWAWVGASVMRAGVHGFVPPNPSAGRGLKQWNPTRYGSLDLTNGGTVTDDSQPFDIYSQIAQMLRNPHGINPFEGMKVTRVYAGGASQGGRYLIRYYNSVQPVTRLYDGFLVGLSGGAPRLDQPTKLLKVYTENDVWRAQAAVRVPDADAVHTWEIAGASHVGTALTSADRRHFRAILGGIRDRDIGQQQPPHCVRPPSSDVETWAVYSAAYAALDRWVKHGVKPAPVERIRVSEVRPEPQFSTIVRDDDGFAIGGIRLPKIALPTALNTGENQPASNMPENQVCVVYGTHVPFEPARLKRLYASRAIYMREVKRVVDSLVRQGFVLKEDAPTLIRNAEVRPD